MGDEYVSVEHFLLPMTEDGGPAGKILKEFGVTRGRLASVLKDVRGSQKVTTPNPRRKGTRWSRKMYKRRRRTEASLP